MTTITHQNTFATALATRGKTALRGLAIVCASLAMVTGAQAQGHGGRGGGHYAHGGGGYHGGGHYGHGRGGSGWIWGGLGLGLGLGLASYYSSYPYYYADPGYVVVEPPPVVYSSPPPVVYATPVPARSAPAPVIYPRSGQNAAQLDADANACSQWAGQQPNATVDGSVFRRATQACMDARGYTVR